MMQTLTFVNQAHSDIIRPVDVDKIYYTELCEGYTPEAFRGVSIKYAVSGSISYLAGNRRITADSQYYVIGDRRTNAQAFFRSEQMTRSLCADISCATISEVYSVLAGKHDAIDFDFDQQLLLKDFPAVKQIKKAGSGPVAARLERFAAAIQTEQISEVSREWFLSLTEELITRECNLPKDIPAKKESTRKEIIKRLEIAHEFITESFLSISNIHQVAVQCNMSEYHFFRCFRQVYGMTPNQMITAKKMELAKQLVEKRESRISDIALLCNYSDVFTFSKAFKRYCGVSPINYSRDIQQKENSFQPKINFLEQLLNAG